MVVLLYTVQALVDVQLWSLSDYKDVSSLASNEAGSAAICIWRSWLGMCYCHVYVLCITCCMYYI